MKRGILILFTLISIAASDFLLVKFDAEIQNNVDTGIEVNWITKEDSSVEYYILKRKMSHQSTFQKLVDIQKNTAQETFNGLKYTYFDKNVFKQSSSSEPIVYALYTYKNGREDYVSQVDVTYTTTTVRRTWGSIKAMFQ